MVELRAPKSVLEGDQKVKDIAKAMPKHQSKKGTFEFLSKMLDRRRLTHAVPDGAFKRIPTFDNVMVMQLSDNPDEEHFAGTGIIKPVMSERKEKEEAPRGLLIGAGLSALDALRSNGIDLGHFVSFIRQAPWHMKVDTVATHGIYCLVLRAGDIKGSEDTMTWLVEGKLQIRTRDEDGVKVHYYVKFDEDGTPTVWNPTEPFLPDDY
ncbi:MAG: hypothetical protein V3U34_00390 [candidate division NC10 bacterium]